jgi:UDP-2,3-diacylglucosamine hydrolase
MSLFFISDLHLHPSRPEITQAFYDFLSSVANEAEALYILGDFFEAWLGDDDVTPMYSEVIQRLSEYSKGNGGGSTIKMGEKHPIPVYVMHGNRDFLLGDKFAKQANITLLNDPSVIKYYGQSYLLMHGDSLCTKDDDYMAFRKMTRTPEWQQQVLSLSLKKRREYAASLRQKSQDMTSLKADDILDVTPEEVIKKMTEHSVTTFIHGHTHRPNIHDLTINNAPAKRVVLGDWEQRGWYVEIKENLLSLEFFNIPPTHC